MADTNARIETTVRNFTAELQQLIGAAVREHVEAALGRFGASAKPARAEKAAIAAPAAAAKAAKAPKATRTRKKGAKRTAAELDRTVKELIDYVSAKPGQRMEEISVALSTPTKDLSRPLQKLLDTGAIRREGVKRASRYFATGGSAGAEAASAATGGDAGGKAKRKGRQPGKAAAAKAPRGKKG